MNEERFQALMREAVGDAPISPWLSDAVRARVAQPAPPASRAPLALVAAILVLAILAIALVPRILNRTHSITPGGIATPSRLEPLNCTLPVIIYDQTPGPDPSQPWINGSQAAKLWGFVNTRTGQFTPDPSASPVHGMPVDLMYESSATAARTGTPPQQALSYSRPTGRWLPVGPARLSPDGLSYAYLGDMRATTLMRYDIATGQRVKVWQAGVQIGIIRWTASGILVSNSGPGTSQVWLVNPKTGVPTEVPPAASVLPPPSSAPAQTLGTTAAGEVIREEAVLNGPSVTIWVYYDTAGGKRVLIYHDTGPTANLSDVNGVTWHKGTGFDPGAGVADGGEIWFSTFAPSLTVWHWDKTRGLGQVDIVLVDPNVLTSMPAGSCF